MIIIIIIISMRKKVCIYNQSRIWKKKPIEHNDA